MANTTQALHAFLPRATGSGITSRVRADKPLVDTSRNLSLLLSQPDLSPARLGALGEDYACDFLVRHEWTIVDRNWHCRYGELDIIALDPACTLAFVEVKTRRGVRHGSPQEAVTPRKLASLRHALGLWLDENGPVHTAIRIDVVSILVMPDGRGHCPNLLYIPGVQ